MQPAIRIELESGITNHRLEKWAEEARTWLGVQVESIEEVQVYKIQPHHTENDGEIISRMHNVFVDPTLQTLHTKDGKYTFDGRQPSFVAEISFRPGVTDNPARSAAEAFSLVGIDADVASGSLYFMFGDIDKKGAEKIAQELFSNTLIQKAEVWAADDFYKMDRFDSIALPKVELSSTPQIMEVSLDLDDTGLEALSKNRCLALTVDELKHIRDYYSKPDIQVSRKSKKLPINPTDVEIEILAQSWSEHCKHKIFSAKIDYQDASGEKQTIDSLYRTYIKGATSEIAKTRKLDWLISVFSDNAGIVRFDEKIDLCIKVETHNSPSALDPYGGALTGILGVNRDILGCGMGARPIANTDVFCFAPPDMPKTGEEKYMPDGPKSPRRVLEGVHRGVEDGGNKSGIPTINGAFFFDRDYAGKPLVFVGTVGAMPHTLPDGRPSSAKELSSGDRIMMVGGAIGADGVHGATFSSLELNDDAPATAVQIGDPLTQKRVTDFLLEARDLGLYSTLTDNGAGGLSSSVGEMAIISNGASLDLALCPVKYPGLSAWELMVSESQERMTFAVPPSHAASFLNLAKKHGVDATDIGDFNNSGKLTIFYDGKLAAELELKFMHDSLPQMELTAEWTGSKHRSAWSPTTALNEAKEPLPANIESILIKLLSSPNITSKEKWVRSYDHEVQAATHQKPFIGKYSDGVSDAGVIWLYPHGGGEDNGIAIGCGLAPRLSIVDPYLMAQFAVDEAVRNVVASGGDPDMCCLLDNFCWSDPVVSAKNPGGAYKLGQLVRACRGLYDICKDYGTPLVSGKDSMKNDFRGADRRGQEIAISVLPTLLITAMSRVPMGATVGSDFKDKGDLIYLLGENRVQGLSSSEFSCHFETESKEPSIDSNKNMMLYRKLHIALKQSLVKSVHDISEGGLLVAFVESMIGGRLGAKLFMDNNEKDFTDIYFNEAPGRFIVSIAPKQQAAFEEALSGCDILKIGCVTEEAQLSFKGSPPVSLKTLIHAWQKGF